MTVRGAVSSRWVRGAALWWDAWGSGIVLNRWSALVSLLVAAVFSVPAVKAPPLEAFALGSLIGAIGWVLLAAGLAPIVVVEKLVRRRTVRAVVVMLAIIGAAAARPFVNDLVATAIIGDAPLGSWSARAVSNTVTALALFSLIALIVAQHRATRAATARVRVAARALEAAVAARRAADLRLREHLINLVASLRDARDRLLAGIIDFDAVRAYSDIVRAASHRLSEMQPSSTESAASANVPSRPAVTRTVPLPMRNRLPPTPRVSVSLLYGLAVAPLAAAIEGIVAAVAVIVIAIPVDLLASVAVRAGARSPRPALVFVATWISVGLVAAIVTLITFPSVGILAFVPLLAIPTTAIVISLCRDALVRVRREEREATAELILIADESARGEADAAEEVRRATDLLHGGLQGKCVVFAAAVDEDPPTPDQIDAFRRSTDAVLDDVVSSPPDAHSTARVALERVLDTWDSVIIVTSYIDEVTAAVLETSFDAEAIVRIVNEALLNAVKHSAARSATLRIDTEDSGVAHVSIASAGTLSNVARAGLGSRDHAVFIRQAGADVVLEARVPLGA